MRLVICDDASVLRAIVERQCERLGHDIVGASGDLASAVASAGAERPDAIFLDGRLADPIGPAIAALLDASPGSEIYVIASLEERALVRTARAAGAAGALRRPILRSDLLATLGGGRSEDASNG